MSYRNDLIKGKQAQLDLTVEELAAKSGLGKSTIQKIRLGQNIKIDTLEQIAAALDLDIAELFTAKPEGK
jgi:Predicted transcriptional regulator